MGVTEPTLRPGPDLLAEGRALAGDWHLGPSAFLRDVDCPCEAAYKRAAMAKGRIMRHAQIGFRDPAKSRRAYAEIHDVCAGDGIRVDRYGICLDWSMGYRRDDRAGRPRGTGLILEGPEDFAALTAVAPVAPHFGDFVLGFPAALENTQAALAAGCTAIGNLGQYFTFRLPDWDDDVALTEATVTALGLIAAQEFEILVHSNLDDGFAAVFTDLASCLGAALIERYIVEDLIGATMSHCYGHHFSDPLTRLAFHKALASASPAPGTMVYGNTTSYRGDAAANYASLAGYLLTDILAQRRQPSGHAINPVPVTENERIPDVEEIVSAQRFAARLCEQAEGLDALHDDALAEPLAARIVAGGRAFRDALLAGLAADGVDVADAAQLLLALRRIGGKRLEERFGPGARDAAAPRGRRPLVPATTITEIAAMAESRLQAVQADDRRAIVEAGLTVLVATTDVHEHGKLLVEQLLRALGIDVEEGGVSCDPDDLAEQARAVAADAIALSTYNGVALRFAEALTAELSARDLALPVLIGGRLNQIPSASNSSLPVDVGADLTALGLTVCRDAADLVPAMAALARNKRELPE